MFGSEVGFCDVEKTILASVEGGTQIRVKRASVNKKNKTIRVDKYLENFCREGNTWVSPRAFWMVLSFLCKGSLNLRPLLLPHLRTTSQ